MTVLAARNHGPLGSAAAADGTDPVAAQIVVRLRDAAEQMVPFSPTKGLLREAAFLIERLESALRLTRAG